MFKRRASRGNALQPSTLFVEQPMAFTVFAQLLAPEAVLAVLLLAALVLREDFGPVDIVRWVLAGSLPYLALPHTATKELASALPEFPLQLLQPQGAA